MTSSSINVDRRNLVLPKVPTGGLLAKKLVEVVTASSMPWEAYWSTCCSSPTTHSKQQMYSSISSLKIFGRASIILSKRCVKKVAAQIAAVYPEAFLNFALTLVAAQKAGAWNDQWKPVEKLDSRCYLMLPLSWVWRMLTRIRRIYVCVTGKTQTKSMSPSSPPATPVPYMLAFSASCMIW